MISGLSAARVGRLDIGMVVKMASLTQPCACRQTCVAVDDSSEVKRESMQCLLIQANGAEPRHEELLLLLRRQ